MEMANRIFRRCAIGEEWRAHCAACQRAADGVCAQACGRSGRAGQVSPLLVEPGCHGRGNGGHRAMLSRGGDGPACAGRPGHQRNQLSSAKRAQARARQGREWDRRGIVRASRLGGGRADAGMPRSGRRADMAADQEQGKELQAAADREEGVLSLGAGRGASESRAGRSRRVTVIDDREGDIYEKWARLPDNTLAF